MIARPQTRPARLFTLGHSNRSFEAFLSLLKEFEVGAIADVRRYPSSRKFPHFNQCALSASLAAQGIEYVWFENLGGRRHSGKKEDSPNIGLTSPGYRNYADYMMTEAFRAAAEDLLSLGAEKCTVIMCAEKFYWKCHRRLLCDYLVAHRIAVEHIMEGSKTRRHALTPGARLAEDGHVIYPCALFP